MANAANTALRAPDGLPIDDCRIDHVQALRSPESIIAELPCTAPVARLVDQVRRSIHSILSNQDRRLVIVVGPCSIHDDLAALRYAQWLRRVAALFARRLLVVMRVYVAKPRTHVGWKGLVNDPRLDGSCQVNQGLALARAVMRNINLAGVPVATEFVDPITPQYIADLVSWGSIGARTSESQVHRELASGLSCPVGFKNGTTGDVNAAINAIAAARCRHQFMGVTRSGTAAIISTTGNHDCHLILRGGVTPNYDEATVSSTASLLNGRGLCDRIMIDCSHANCGGNHRRQVDVARDVCDQLASGSRSVMGVMIESNLVEGRQTLDSGEPLVVGKSITDACLGLDDTERVLAMLDRAVAARADSPIAR